MKINFLNNTFDYKKNLKIQRVKKYIIIAGITIAISIFSNMIAKSDEITYDTKKNIVRQNQPNIKKCLSSPSISEIENTFKIIRIDINDVINSIKEEKEKNEIKIEKKLVAITFDDGPGIFTDRLLDILEENNAKATFFVTGTSVENYSNAVKRAYDLGNEIGIHGYTHTSFTELTIDKIQDEINKVSDLLTDLDITPSNLVRPPYGSIDNTIKENLDYSFILWYVDTRDWESLNKDAVKEQIRSNIEEGSIILMHDIHETTIDAVEEILPELIDEYEFVTVEELFKRNEQELEEHESYRKVKVLEKVEE